MALLKTLTDPEITHDISKGAYESYLMQFLRRPLKDTFSLLKFNFPPV